MNNFLLLLVLSVACGSVHASCRLHTINFTGKVVDLKGMPVAHAAVGLAWQEHDGVSGPATATTNTRGEYSLSATVNTYSGDHGAGDECNLRLKVIAVSASKGNLQSPYYRFKIGNLTSVRVPVLKLFKHSDNFLRVQRPAGG